MSDSHCSALWWAQPPLVVMLEKFAMVVEILGGWHQDAVRYVGAGGGGGSETIVGEAGHAPPAWICCHPFVNRQ